MNDDELVGWAQEAFAERITPAVLIDVERVRHNLDRAFELLGGPDRWRPHVKTARIPWTIGELRRRGVRRFKAATTAELSTLLSCGATDVLLAYPAVGPTQAETLRLARRHPLARVSVLVDDLGVARAWESPQLATFIDIDTGQGRTGIPVEEAGRVLEVMSALRERGATVLGLHSYDGHLSDRDIEEKQTAVDAELRALVSLGDRLESRGWAVEEVIAGSTHTAEQAARTPLPPAWSEKLTLGPGTVVYNDLRAMARHDQPGYEMAAFAVARVVSAGPGNRVTLDSGLTTLQVDAGRPHAAVVGLDAQILSASQEHLEIVIADTTRRPQIGDAVLLAPRHVDTMLVQFDAVHLVDGGSTWVEETPRRPL